MIDQVNHGDSAVRNRGKLGTNFNWIDGARDVLKIATCELGSIDSHPALNVVIGHSMGGFQALACDVLQPNLFHLLILIEPVVITRKAIGAGRPGLPPDSPQIPENLYNSLRLKTCDHFANESEYVKYMRNGSFFIQCAQPNPAKTSSILRGQKPLETMKMVDPFARRWSRLQNLLCYMNMQTFAPFLISNVKFVRKRTIHIVGARSNWCPPQNQLFLQKTLPNYHLDVIPGGSHLVNVEAPDLVIERINHHIHEFVLTSPLQSSHIPQLTLEERAVMFDRAFDSFKNEALVKTTKQKL